MIPVEHAHLRVAAATHPGMKGKLNEDRYSVTAYQLAPDDHTAVVLALLADGVGGHRAGEVAAQLAVENVIKYVAGSNLNLPVRVLKQAFTYTNQVILNHANENPSMVGMGTTCVCAWVIGDQLYASAVGDSRLYLLRGNRLIRLTTDHTWIQEALSQGTLSPDHVKGHPNAHIIRRFLGSANAVNPDVRLRLSPAESDALAEANQGFRLLPGDRLMLCSDGLTDLVEDPEIQAVLRSKPLEASPAQLIGMANQRGGHDNITVVVLEVPQAAQITHPTHLPPATLNAPASKYRRSFASWLMMFLLILAIIVMLLLLVYLYSR